ncbi:zinc finger BED domain-containing protein 4-like [Triplophysa dalaica]|uniref:zinc finger BED domain-containing protein 4-like n=1 Tax=Triplophysa dalaica TaxID=1582913 RepID=UPI0024DF4B7C|nr:zinc finger BED domain-containing protein 4-like [Triplophysa dalaica]
MADNSRAPQIVTFGYKDYELDRENKKRFARCRVCNTRISDTTTTTSNFIRHYKNHKERYDEYLKTKIHCSDLQQPSMSQFIVPQTTTYPVNHPRQKAITEAIISDLIINSNMPLSITDNKLFIHFLSIMDAKYTAVSRRTVTSRLEAMVSERRSKLIREIATVENLSVTVDIWSDRRMRGYLGVTGHWMDTTADAITLKSHLLACNRFKGSHTGERICANMKKAFTTCFPSSDEADENDDDCLDDAELWNALPVDEEERLNVTLTSKSQHRLQCFAHTLQLVVGDGLKETRAVSAALAKASRISSLLHTSTSFKEEFEKEFGQRGVPASVVTRWNSTFRQVKSLLSCDYQTLCKVLDVRGHRETIFTVSEWAQIKDLVSILKPFADANDLTQGDKVVTISAVIPCVLSLNHHLENQKERTQYLVNLVHSLQRSLQKRFKGIFVNVKMSQQHTNEGILPFSDPVYVKAAVLDPAFGVMWIEHDVLVDDKLKEQLTMEVKNLILEETDHTIMEQTGHGDEEEQIKGDETGLFVYHKKLKKSTHCSPAAQLNHYLDNCDGQNCLLFWGMNKEAMPSLFQIAMRVLAVPASSAPVERVFSHGGIIMRPHRSQLSANVLSNLIFCKCNTF